MRDRRNCSSRQEKPMTADRSMPASDQDREHRAALTARPVQGGDSVAMRLATVVIPHVLLLPPTLGISRPYLGGAETRRERQVNQPSIYIVIRSK
jgi:hypothetical protein